MRAIYCQSFSRLIVKRAKRNDCSTSIAFANVIEMDGFRHGQLSSQRSFSASDMKISSRERREAVNSTRSAIFRLYRAWRLQLKTWREEE